MNITPTFEIRALLRVMKSNNYIINEKPYQINIVGVRKDSVTPNAFDDKIYTFWKDDKGKWEGRDYVSTTDPSTYWLKSPMNVDGTAILKAGQYAYKLGTHKGYEALNQRGMVTVIRDYDRNAVLDFNNGKESKGFFGINIHRASSTGTTKNVDKWSAGCQVFADAKDWNDFMANVKRSVSNYGNETLYYTLIDERAMNRKMKRWVVYFILGVATTVVVYGGSKYLIAKP
jgi:hypothetical protein